MTFTQQYLSGNLGSHTIVGDITENRIGDLQEANNGFYKNNVISRFITQALNMVRLGIIHNMSRKKKIASGLTTNSLKVVRDTPMSGFVESGSRGLEFAQTGRSRGKIPKRFDRIIRRWIDDKGIPLKDVPIKNPKRARLPQYERNKRVAARNIAHSIAEKGTVQKRRGWTNIYTHEISRAKVWLFQRVSRQTLQTARQFFKDAINKK